MFLHRKLGRLIGKQFGFLKCLERQGSIDGFPAYLCICVCGVQLVARGGKLLDGTLKSCKGARACRTMILDVAREEKSIWTNMIARCYNKSCSGYYNYGALGIRVCARWRNDFFQFLSDMGPRPSKRFSLDRYPDPTGDYDPGNCRWATRKQQMQNTRVTAWVDYNGEQRKVCELAEMFGLKSKLVISRLYQGWELDRALMTPVKVKVPKHNPFYIEVERPPPLTTCELARLVGATHWADSTGKHTRDY